tara:strand:- start:408 stop:1445 length:1038 start_codon:yes stop_codon:yes gene_type:complete
MKKRLFVFVFIIISLFIVSGCDGIKGGKIDKSVGDKSGDFVDISVDIKVKDTKKGDVIYFDKDSNSLLYNNVPVEVHPGVNVIRGVEDRGNMQGGIPVLDFINTWITAVANDVLYNEIKVIDPEGNLVSLTQLFSEDPNLNIPLIRNRQIVYDQGREIVYQMGDFTEEMEDRYADAVTTRLKVYYFDDLLEFRRGEDHEEFRVALYERLGDLGNDMDYEDYLYTSLTSYGRDGETYTKWFVFYGQYFDENGEAIDNLGKVIYALTQSEESMLSGFNDPENPFWWVASGLSRLTSSRRVGENVELSYSGLLFGVMNNDRRNLHPHFRGRELYIEPEELPADRLDVG